jgi:glycosyltransferase involved in cell wall biosynthesis
MMREPIDIVIPTCKALSDVTDRMGDAVRTSGLQNVRVIATCTPQSAAKNRNLALDLATSDPLIMMDDDVTDFPASWARHLLDVFREHADCVMLSPQLMQPSHAGGAPALMMGMDELYLDRTRIPSQGLTILPSHRLLTACVVIHRNKIRFDENFVGAGFEDNAYCDDLRAVYPDGQWMVCHDVKVVHHNEMKNQPENWERNRRYYQDRRRRPA